MTHCHGYSISNNAVTFCHRYYINGSHEWVNAVSFIHLQYIMSVDNIHLYIHLSKLFMDFFFSILLANTN